MPVKYYYGSHDAGLPNFVPIEFASSKWYGVGRTDDAAIQKDLTAARRREITVEEYRVQLKKKQPPPGSLEFSRPAFQNHSRLARPELAPIDAAPAESAKPSGRNKDDPLKSTGRKAKAKSETAPTERDYLEPAKLPEFDAAP